MSIYAILYRTAFIIAAGILLHITIDNSDSYRFVFIATLFIWFLIRAEVISGQSTEHFEPEVARTDADQPMTPAPPRQPSIPQGIDSIEEPVFIDKTLTEVQSEIAIKLFKQYKKPLPAIYEICSSLQAEKLAELFSSDLSCLNYASNFWGKFRSSRTGRIARVKNQDIKKSESIWFIGDIHGDLVGLSATLAYILDSENDGKANVVLLGDLIDDGCDSLSVLVAIHHLALLNNNLNIMFLVGNHDIALGWSKLSEKFYSTVQPSTFYQELNDCQDAAVLDFVRAHILALQQMPVALFLPDGTFAAHGGVPHTDQLNNISTLEDLSLENCINDFIWNRVTSSWRKDVYRDEDKFIHEIGYLDWDDFRKHLSNSVGIESKRMIRGHCHFDERYHLHKGYGNRVLTINNMSQKLDREFGKDDLRTPSIVKWTPNTSLEVDHIYLPETFRQMCEVDNLKR